MPEQLSLGRPIWMSLVWGTAFPHFHLNLTTDYMRRTYSTNSNYGYVSNFYQRDGETLSAGGSSGGSAVAVASGQSAA